ncbi:MAG: histone deacetylase [Treponema sp.]|jgi:acetoin utilization deacetylase AcuC-like enzyme|nr:histone deacetylase [Treponema sp.]
MILHDPAVIVNYSDFGIMLPIPADRGKRVLEFLNSARVNNTSPGNAHNVLDFSSAMTRHGLEGQIISRADMERVHSKKYIAALYGDGLTDALLKTYELIDSQGRPYRYEPDRAARPLSDMFQILTAQAGGTYLACLLALSDTGFCYYLGGGMHHARFDSPSGFCLINDIAIAAFMLLNEKNACLSHEIRSIWIIDMDAHKGDGTAEIVSFAGEKERIFTLSIHMANGWPLDSESIASAEEGRAPLLPSCVDIGIGAGEEAFYAQRLSLGIRQLEKISGKTPDFAIVVDGADPYEHDGLPSTSLLRLTLDQCIERDILVYRYLRERNIPSAWIQSGGYGDRAWEPPAHFLKRIL